MADADTSPFLTSEHIFFAACFLNFGNALSFESNTKIYVAIAIMEGAGNCNPTLNETWVFLRGSATRASAHDGHSRTVCVHGGLWQSGVMVIER
jgi:hypothetical protein